MAFSSFCRVLGGLASTRTIPLSSHYPLSLRGGARVAAVRWTTSQPDREEFEESLAAFETAKESGISLPECISFMKACRFARKLKEGRECFDYMENLGFGERSGLEEMIQMLYDDPEEGTKMLEEFDRRGLNRTRGAYHTLIAAWAQKNELAKAQALFDDMEARNVRINSGSVCAIMNAYLLNGDVKKVMENFGQFDERNLPAGERGYELALRACVRKSEYYERAFEIFDQMEKEGFTPNRETLSHLLKAACMLRNPEKIDIVYNKMDDPTHSEIKSVIFAFLRLQNWKKMQLYFVEMTETHGMSPDRMTASNMISGCWKNEDPQSVFQMGAKYFCDLRKAGSLPNSGTMSSLRWCLGASTSIDPSMQEFRDVVRVLEAVPERNREKEWYALMMSVASKGYDFEKTLLLHSEMRAKGLGGDMDFLAVKAFSRLERLEGAVALLQDKETPVSDRVVTLMLRTFASSRDAEKTDICYREYLARGMRGSVDLFDLLATTSPDPAKLLEFFEEANKYGHRQRAKVYDLVIFAHRHLGIKLLREMRAKRIVAKLRTIKLVIPLVKEEGLLEEERELLLVDLQKAGLQEEEVEGFLERY